MRSAILSIALLVGGCSPLADEAQANEVTQVAEGTIFETGPFAVEGLPDQKLTIWLPPGYATSGRRYPVLYMHDGHNLFDPAQSNFNKVWAADKAIIGLAERGTIEPHIIVGMWPHGEDRYRQYLPQFAAENAAGSLRDSVIEIALGRNIVSARYLEWIADELKPQIDADYRNLTRPPNTAIVGSSMGGIMSCYAIVERPDIFGRAACISSHWPIALPESAEANKAQVDAIWRDWLSEKLGDPDGRRIWMDHGTETLDAYYPPYQTEIEKSFMAAGWNKGTDWRSEQYDGAEHEENAWAERLPEVLGWLLAKE
ncbi:hypothetical protein GRI43_08515 [Altererythrobacter luteolus]|uniref:Esterase n=1 Tax=Pontixanthobacter luteolus TaxID=295089 RepID=A0A6I4V666_9SPHN|nr:alpha/beta hydrolase-fold protein [Pontixanthobacter luteolus]MXP47422.1 hypothetical protein [Pontixanthobacter luteolus]